MEKVIRRISEGFVFAGMVLALGVVLFASIDVFNRLAVGASLAWAQQAAVWVNIFVVFLVAPPMLFIGGHVRVLFLFDKLKGLTRKIADFLNQVAVITFCGLALWGGLAYVIYLEKMVITRVFGMIRFPFYIIALGHPVCMSLFLIFGIFGLSLFIVKLWKQEEK